MKKIMMILAILLIPIVMADVQNFKKEFKIELDNRTIIVTSDNLNYETDLSISGDSISDWEKEFELNWYQNISCETDREMSVMKTKVDEVKDMIEDMEKDYGTYYNKYLGCIGNLSQCNSYKSSNEDAITKYNTLKETHDNINLQWQACSQQKQQCDQRLNDVQDECDKCKQNRTLAWVIAAAGVIWFIVSMFKYVRPMTRGGTPPMMDGGVRGLESR